MHCSPADGRAAFLQKQLHEHQQPDSRQTEKSRSEGGDRIDGKPESCEGIQAVQNPQTQKAAEGIYQQLPSRFHGQKQDPDEDAEQCQGQNENRVIFHGNLRIKMLLPGQNTPGQQREATAADHDDEQNVEFLRGQGCRRKRSGLMRKGWERNVSPVHLRADCLRRNENRSERASVFRVLSGKETQHPVLCQKGWWFFYVFLPETTVARGNKLCYNN